MAFDNWGNTTLGEFVRLQRGHDLTEAERRPGAIPVMGSAGPNGVHDTAKAKGPGVTIGRSGVGSMGVVSYCEVDYWPHNTVLYVTDFLGNNPLFTFYFLRQLNLRRFDSGSAQASLNRNFVYPIEIHVPSPPEQRAIASILGALDDKIELNRRMNETLEAMARAIFKDSFVDFGPVRAKQEGRAPYLAPDIWSLFPDRLDDEGKPEGWQTSRLEELCARVAIGPFGSDITTDNFVGHGVPVIRGVNLKDGFIEEGFVYITEEKAESLRNANAFPGNIVLTHRGTLGQVGIIPSNSKFPRYIISQSQMVLAADPKRTTPRFLFEFLRSPLGRDQLLANTSQTGVPAIARPTTSLKALRLTDPGFKVIETFDHTIGPLVERENVSSAESRTLAALRDLLLPKLMSGEIRVKDAEKLVGQAA